MTPASIPNHPSYRPSRLWGMSGRYHFPPHRVRDRRASRERDAVHDAVAPDDPDDHADNPADASVPTGDDGQQGAANPATMTEDTGVADGTGGVPMALGLRLPAPMAPLTTEAPQCFVSPSESPFPRIL